MRHFGFSLLTSVLYATGISANDPSDASILINEAARANNNSLLWGPYKSNLYFGVRPRIANSLAAGLMWAKVDDFATAQQSKSTFKLQLQTPNPHRRSEAKC
jgi:mannosyl-oligosaccharide glucosidase